MSRKKATKINGNYLSTLEHNDKMDYNCEINDNINFLRRISKCLKGECTGVEVEQVINQLDCRIIEITNEIKIKQGDEGYPGLMIRN